MNVLNRRQFMSVAVVGAGSMWASASAGTESAHSYKFGNNAQHFAITKRTLRAEAIGAVPNGADMQPAFNAAFEHLKDIGGGCLELDREGDYIIGSAGNMRGIRIEDPNCTIRIENKSGGILRAAPDLPTAVLWIGGTTDAGVLDAEAHLHGLRINNADGRYVVGDASCTGLILRWLKRAFVHDYECIGSYDATLDVPTRSGDAGIGSVGTLETYVFNPHIVGQADAAMYPNWDNTGTVRGLFQVQGGLYKRNSSVATPKRGLELFVLDGAVCEGNVSGIIASDVGESTALPRVGMLVRETVFKKTRANVIRNVGGGKTIVEDCLIQDVGRFWDGSDDAGGNGRAIINFGGRTVEVRDTEFQMKEWPPTAQYAFAEGRYTADGYDLPSEGFYGRNLTLTNWPRFYVGTNDEASGTSEFRDVLFKDLPAGETELFVNVDNPTTIIDYKIFGKKAEKRWQNGATMSRGG